MGDDLGDAVPAPKVVKVITVDGEQTELKPDFVDVCCKVKERVDDAGPCQSVEVSLADVYKVGVKKAIDFWQESKASSFNGGEFVTSLGDEDVKQLVTAAVRLGYDPLFKVVSEEYRRRLSIMVQDPNFKSECTGDPDEVFRAIDHYWPESD